MNPLVFMILFAERDMEIQLQKNRDLDAVTKTIEPAPRPEQKSRKQVSNHARPQKSCGCS